MCRLEICCIFLVLLVFSAVEARKHNHTNDAVVIINPKTLKPYKSNGPKLKQLQRPANASFSNWGEWSRCMKCVQRRMMTCIDPEWCDSRIYEERICPKVRCKRKSRERLDFNVVHLNKSSNFLLKQAPSEAWTQWFDWQPCSTQCKTTRLRYCRKPGRCNKSRQQQNAFCFYKGSQCENYVLQLIDASTQQYDNRRRYEYGSEVVQTRPRKKRRCGRPHKKSRMLKIIGGREAKKYKWPWHVAVINRFDEVFCGGTLIAPRWILTASHCIRSYLKVRINEHDLTAFDGREKELRVSQMFRHPKFNDRTVDNDIALLLLPYAVKSPSACLPHEAPSPGSLCSVMGWGKLNSNHKYGTPVLHEAKLPIIPKKTCEHAYKQFKITGNMMCAGWSSGKRDTCAGDSGGGLMCPVKNRTRTYQVNGITSFGDGCGVKNKFGIYTTVYNYVPWINYIMDNYS